MSFSGLGSAMRPVAAMPQVKPAHQHKPTPMNSIHFGGGPYDRLPNPINMISIFDPPLPGIDVVVGMNDKKSVPANKSGGTHSLGGCTSIDVIYSDNTKLVTHYAGEYVIPHINLIKENLSGAKAVLIYTPQDPRKPGVPKEPTYENELKAKFPSVLTIAYDKSLQHGQKNNLLFKPNGNQTHITDGRGLIDINV